MSTTIMSEMLHQKFLGNVRSDVNKWLTEDPPELQWIFKDLLLRGIVAGIMSQGGVGKSYLSLSLAISCATGQKVFDYFIPSKPMRVMVFFGEDSEGIVWRRFKAIVKDLSKQGVNVDEVALVDNLYPVCGISAPLMKLVNNNPHVTKAYYSLVEKVKEFKPDLIIIDPKAQWFGMEENSNDYNTQWVNCLKDLTHINNSTVWFTHHVNKQGANALDSSASRGGSALVDNCRLVANIIKMDNKTGKSFGINNPQEYIEFQVTKNNYAPPLPDVLYFKKLEGGVLRQVNLQTHKFVDITSILEDILRNDSNINLSIDQIVNKTDGKIIRDKIKDRVGGKVTAKDIEFAINRGINKGIFTIKNIIAPKGRKSRQVLHIK